MINAPPCTSRFSHHGGSESSPAALSGHDIVNPTARGGDIFARGDRTGT